MSNSGLKHRPTLGIVGCGNIGGRQAANFLAHGYPVRIYDTDTKRMAALQQQGAGITRSRAELAACSDIIFTALPTPADVTQAVLAGEQNLSQGLRPGSIYIDITTNAPATVLRLHEAMVKLGVEMLDAPFNDCPAGAKSQGGMGLAVLASGSRATFERVRPVLELMADRVLYCGEIGRGTQCKLIHNAVNAVAVQAVSEGITLGLAQGIALPILWDALRFGSFGQNAGDIHGLPHYWFSRRCDDPSQHPAFTLELLHKDLRLTLAMARQCGVPVPHIDLTVQDYVTAEQRGWSTWAATKIRCLQEERAGVLARADPPISPGAAQQQPEKFENAVQTKGGFSLFVVLALIVLSNLVQFCLHWLF